MLASPRSLQYSILTEGGSIIFEEAEIVAEEYEKKHGSSFVGDIEWVNCSYKSIRGEIISNWHIENNIFYMDASVPGNTTARIFIPAANKESVFESDIPASNAKGIEFIQFKNNCAEFEAGSGKYHSGLP
jgi:hypothetical protein